MDHQLSANQPRNPLRKKQTPDWDTKRSGAKPFPISVVARKRNKELTAIREIYVKHDGKNFTNRRVGKH